MHAMALFKTVVLQSDWHGFVQQARSYILFECVNSYQVSQEFRYVNVFSDTSLSEQPNAEDNLVMRFRTCFICLRLGIIL